MSDVLEDKVDDKYFLSQEAIDGIIKHDKNAKAKGNGFKTEMLERNAKNSYGICATYWKGRRSPMILEKLVDGAQAQRIYSSDGLSATINGNGGGQGGKTGLYAVDKKKINPICQITQHKSIYDSSGLNPCLNACDYKDPTKVAIPFITPDRKTKRQNGRRFKTDGEPMFTLTSQDRHGVMLGADKKYGILIHEGREYNVRKLTPRECFRLQGFPDELFEKARARCSDTQLYKQAGNAVTVNVSRYFGKLILKRNADEQEKVLKDS